MKVMHVFTIIELYSGDMTSCCQKTSGFGRGSCSISFEKRKGSNFIEGSTNAHPPTCLGVRSGSALAPMRSKKTRTNPKETNPSTMYDVINFHSIGDKEYTAEKVIENHSKDAGKFGATMVTQLLGGSVKRNDKVKSWDLILKIANGSI